MSKISKLTGHIVSLKSNGKEVWGIISQDQGGKIEMKPISREEFKFKIYEKVSYEREMKTSFMGLTGTKSWAIKLKRFNAKNK
ncbi:hypothetical protein KY340_00670 [Candidatus Woesearchaeota archaeon]|nr:hypothetical protein [Candidatus Woesearchaeota archaeon]